MGLVHTLRDFAPSAHVFVAEVMSIGPDQTSIVQYPDGSQQSVRGTQVAIGSPAFVVSGQIQGLAPSRTVVTIDI
jgi:hypothetical protein